MKHTLRILSFVISLLPINLITQQTLGKTLLENNEKQAQNIEIDYDYTILGLTVSYQFKPSCSTQGVNVTWDLGEKTVQGKHQFEHTYKAVGNYQTCLSIQTTEGTIIEECKYIRVGDPELCDGIQEPVCGCDNQTYTNACYAKEYYGVFTWTPGPCVEIDYDLFAEYAYDFTGGYSVKFINTSVGNYDAWVWDFGDGKTSESRNPIYNFMKGGKYKVCLTVSSKTTAQKEFICEEVVLDENFQFILPVSNKPKPVKTIKEH